MRQLPAIPVPVLPAPRRNPESWMIDASRVCQSPVPMGLSAADPARTRTRTHTIQAPERVSGPVVGELSRARLNRPALARAIASLGMWAEKERAEKERERERAEKEQERRRVKQTELLQLRGMLSARGAIGE